MDQVEALVHFYFKEEPKDFDRLALLWGRLEFALQFEGKLKKRDIKIV